MELQERKRQANHHFRISCSLLASPMFIQASSIPTVTGQQLHRSPHLLKSAPTSILSKSHPQLQKLSPQVAHLQQP
jgi:hypothetical protein